jgi:hypothetical protein
MSCEVEEERESKFSWSADSNLGKWNQRLPKSRAHAAGFEIRGQPFYGWLVDGRR